ncbi:16S rRNA (cytosine(1402)-N(4))-methyltransferase RsmH [Candidatus Uhrbacteria bacterium]|jgi:16S rRNA (cytosine1402-N4)-methyltransferase|nr:16S rRNA (cytosine(1402)-N(4))-methyltransferase RsmH [Candidatus Uhrbacteria bacterium]MBT7717701.1 16S rRNA (cytosine(1402)-N(4))-methyltransferase RsmH [Candidatus Uhrbacteria bacterium]
MKHVPVLLKEVIDGLSLKENSVVIDATLGLGGHTRAILESVTGARVIGFDRDARNLELAKEELKDVADRIEFVEDSFSGIETHVKEPVDAAFFDIGFSSLHVDDPERGFSFMHDGPLDMRYDQSQELTAEVIVNGWTRDELARIFRKLGEESYAAPIAKAIFVARKKGRITRTSELAEIISNAVRRSGKQHPATKVFQALRIAVNDELGEVEKGLEAAVKVLKPGGVLAVISFHSLEDRIVKNFIKNREDLEATTKRPIKPGLEEIKSNPRARSAKLRIAVKKV